MHASFLITVNCICDELLLIGCINFLINALQINEKNIDIHQMIGTSYIKLNNYDKAVYHLKRALDLSDYESPYVLSNYLEGKFYQ